MKQLGTRAPRLVNCLLILTSISQHYSVLLHFPGSLAYRLLIHQGAHCQEGKKHLPLSSWKFLCWVHLHVPDPRRGSFLRISSSHQMPHPSDLGTRGTSCFDQSLHELIIFYLACDLLQAMAVSSLQLMLPTNWYSVVYYYEVVK